MAKKKKSKPIGLCAFCPQIAEFTGEHVWSKWMSKVLRKQKYLIIQRDAGRNITRKQERKTLDKKIHVVCHDCNTQWMSRLENDKAKPAMKDMVLDSNHKTISRSDIESIVAFTFKQMVVADSGALRPDGRKRNPFFMKSDRRNFARSLTIPQGIQMWIAAVDRHLGWFDSRYFILPPDNAIEIYSFTFACGHLVVQAIGTRIIDPLLLCDFRPFLLRSAPYWDRFITPFYPIQSDSVNWPQREFLPVIELYDFSERWKMSFV